MALTQESGPDLKRVVDALANAAQTKERDWSATKEKQFMKNSGKKQIVLFLTGTEDKQRIVTGLAIEAFSWIHLR